MGIFGILVGFLCMGGDGMVMVGGLEEEGAEQGGHGCHGQRNEEKEVKNERKSVENEVNEKW